MTTALLTLAILINILALALARMADTDSATNAALIQFPQCGATGATITHVGIGVSGTADDSGMLLFYGALSSPLTVANLIQPQFAAGDLDIVPDGSGGYAVESIPEEPLIDSVSAS
jgi:hypothetical protein